MSKLIPPYPLQWPKDLPRTERGKRIGGRFSVTLTKARNDLLKELQLFGGVECVITSNIAGIMESKLADPGVAVWFVRNKANVCFACDRYQSIESNLRAIGLSVEALRSIERHDATFLEQLLAGTTQKRLPASSQQPWYQVLGVGPEASLEDCEAAYRKLALARHPDKGGSQEGFVQLTEAIEQARRERP